MPGIGTSIAVGIAAYLVAKKLSLALQALSDEEALQLIEGAVDRVKGCTKCVKVTWRGVTNFLGFTKDSDIDKLKKWFQANRGLTDEEILGMFEDWVSEPARELKGLTDFLGRPPKPSEVKLLTHLAKRYSDPGVDELLEMIKDGGHNLTIEYVDKLIEQRKKEEKRRKKLLRSRSEEDDDENEEEDKPEQRRKKIRRRK